jgi:NAD(P)H-quinone oxidoreductase subunit 6
MKVGLDTLLFYLFAFIAIPFAYGVLLDRKIIRAGFLLIGVFSAISGLFLLLNAQFLAMAQIMIYAVGITLVVVIALMLTNPKSEDDISPLNNWNKIPGIVSAFLVFITIYMSLRAENWTVRNPGQLMQDNITRIGIDLLTYFSLPFEFASILLLVAVIGAIMLAKQEKEITQNNSDENFDKEELTSEDKNVIKV